MAEAAQVELVMDIQRRRTQEGKLMSMEGVLGKFGGQGKRGKLEEGRKTGKHFDGRRIGH